MTTTKNLSTIGKHFSDEDAARELLESLRWPNGPVCPKCGGDNPYKLTPKATSKAPCRKGVWKCRACRKQFTVTVGTIFEHSHIPISKWLLAIHLLSASKKSMSAHQLHRLLGVTYRAAWFIGHRLRHAMAQGPMQLEGIVEVDETFIGGPTKQKPGYTSKPKTPVMALVERGGRVRAFPIARVDGATLHEAIWSNVKRGSRVMTDEWKAYQGLEKGYTHDTIKHIERKYVNGDISTNTVEGFFGILKRGIVGSFHHVSKGHLHRYCDEFAFRYNTRTKLGFNDGQRAALLVAAAEGKRLTYAEPKSALA